MTPVWRVLTLDQNDDIADALTRLHYAGRPIDDTAFIDADQGGIVHVVIGSKGENQIRAEGQTSAEAWREVLDCGDPGPLSGRVKRRRSGTTSSP